MLLEIVFIWMMIEFLLLFYENGFIYVNGLVLDDYVYVLILC